MIYRSNSGGNTLLGTLFALFFLVAILAGMFFMARMVFRLLYFLGPVIFVAALFVDYTVFLDYLSWLRKLLKRNLLQGLLALVLSVLGYPIVSAFLLIRALSKKKVQAMQKEYDRKINGELVDFEEVETIKPEQTKSRQPLQKGEDSDYADYV